MGLGFERNGGELITVDIDPRMVKAARDNLKTVGLDDVVTVVEGDALEVLPKLEEPRFSQENSRDHPVGDATGQTAVPERSTQHCTPRGPCPIERSAFRPRCVRQCVRR